MLYFFVSTVIVNVTHLRVNNIPAFMHDLLTIGRSEVQDIRSDIWMD